VSHGHAEEVATFSSKVSRQSATAPCANLPCCVAFRSLGSLPLTMNHELASHSELRPVAEKLPQLCRAPRPLRALRELAVEGLLPLIPHVLEALKRVFP
jgi:hypothetical protein